MRFVVVILVDTSMGVAELGRKHAPIVVIVIEVFWWSINFILVVLLLLFLEFLG